MNSGKMEEATQTRGLQPAAEEGLNKPAKPEHSEELVLPSGRRVSGETGVKELRREAETAVKVAKRAGADAAGAADAATSAAAEASQAAQVARQVLKAAGQLEVPQGVVEAANKAAATAAKEAATEVARKAAVEAADKAAKRAVAEFTEGTPQELSR